MTNQTTTSATIALRTATDPVNAPHADLVDPIGSPSLSTAESAAVPGLLAMQSCNYTDARSKSLDTPWDEQSALAALERREGHTDAPREPWLGTVQ